MIFKEMTLFKADGAITTRDLSAITQRASRYASEIFFEIGTVKANAKSVMGILSLGLKSGTKMTVICKGDDEEEALADMERVITGKYV